MSDLKRILVFCGANNGQGPEYARLARRLGGLLARRGKVVVYGGGNVGLMGELANGALEAGGRVVGVIPQSLVAKELAHHGVTELLMTGSLHERKRLMMEQSDGVMALPGGFGTLDELFEVLTAIQLGYHNHPCGLVNHGGYFDHLLAFLATATAEGFLKERHVNRLEVADTPEALLDKLEAARLDPEKQWVKTL